MHPLIPPHMRKSCHTSRSSMIRKTPPESVTHLPLTPLPTQPKSAIPVVQRIITEVRSRKDGHSFSTEPWERFKLDVDEYEYLQQAFQGDWYWIDKLRYESSIPATGPCSISDIIPQIRLFSINQAVRTSNAHYNP